MSTSGKHLHHNHHGSSYPVNKMLPLKPFGCKLRELTQKQKQAVKHRHNKKCRAFKPEDEDVSSDLGVSSNS